MPSQCNEQQFCVLVLVYYANYFNFFSFMHHRQEMLKYNLRSQLEYYTIIYVLIIVLIILLSNQRYDTIHN